MITHNKRMQSDLLKRYALSSAADAGRYVAKARVRLYRVYFSQIVF
jgi:hypothetical protein